MPERHGPAEFPQPPEKIDLSPIFEKLLDGGTLSAEETTQAFESMVAGLAHEAEIGALLALLARRVPTAAELLGAARVMRRHVDAVESTIDPETIVDTAGTGGAPKTFNVSTLAAVIAAGAGAIVAKHGNRSRTGRGSAEVLARLGVNVDAGRETQARCLEEAGICFCFAIHHHPATRHVIGARKALGFATMFNLLGPLTNPAGARRQVMGVYADRFVRPVAEALVELGSSRAMVLHSRDGLDELTVTAPTHIAHVDRGTVREEELSPGDLGFEQASLEDLRATDLDEAATLFRDILANRQTGPKRDMAVLNAAATLVAAGLADDLAEGVRHADDAISSGAAEATLAKLIRLSKED